MGTKPARRESCPGGRCRTAVLDAIRRSCLFTQEKELTITGVLRVVVGFQHELMGKYLAACYVFPFVGQAQDSMPFDLVALSKEPEWLDIFCFLIDKIDSRLTLNRFLRRLLESKSPLHLKLIAYAIRTKRNFLDESIVEDYNSAKLDADLADIPPASGVIH
jgi:hypothetical protein